MKINNYIKYLLILILLQGINIYAQASENLNQIISQAQQEAAGLSPFFNLSFIINSPIIKYLTSTLGSSFLGFAIPFLFVFGVLAFLTYEAKKEINRPLILIYFIIDLLITIFFPAILILLAIILAIVLLFFGFYKLFHTLTGSTIGGITGAIITTLILYVLLNNGTNIIGFLFSSAFYILLFMFFIAIVIFGIRAHAEISSSKSFKKIANDIKYVYYKLKTPQDIKGLKEGVNKTIEDLKNAENDIIDKINKLNKLLININQQNLSKKTRNKIERLYTDIKTFFYQCDKVKVFIDDWKKNINQYYSGPVKSDMLNFLNRKEQEIDLIKRKVGLVYSSKILPKERLIINILGIRKVKGGKKMKKGKKTP